MNNPNFNPNMKLSEHFKLGELTKTSYIINDGNIPSQEAIENLRRLCVDWLEDLRYIYGMMYGDGDVPLIISSGYRSAEVNRLCGGAVGSNHLTGCAVDICCLGPEQMIRYGHILLDLSDEKSHKEDRKTYKNDDPSCENFDEIIFEKRGTTYWIHFAVRPKDNRRKILFDCR